ncbi:MAG: PA14 domain-containing protein [Nostoc sp.]|uniref:PA14 domain-containing protein n=2 Tax=Nostoc sp. TaxID=1180 RepID=UPI002FF93C08
MNAPNQQLTTSSSQTIAPLSSGLDNQTQLSNISPRASASVLSQGDGLKAEYYDNIDFTNLKVTRTDPRVNFVWGTGSPDPSIGADTFSARWTGQVEAKYSETYKFYTTSDDGVRLWVNGQQIINDFVDHSATEDSGSIALVAGQKYDIKLEYYENTYSAVSQLSWSSSSQAKEIIPQSQLYSNVTSNTDVTPPSATANAANLTTSSGNYTFTVVYNDNTAINVNSLDSNDLLVTGANGYSQVAKFVSVDNNSNGSPRTATYSINPVGGSWDAASNGSYTIALRANQVCDTNGNFASAGTIGNFQVNIASGSGSGIGNGTGLNAEYYDNIDFTNLKVTRIDPRVNFVWGTGSPDPSIGADTFSARWTGQVEAKYSETYKFYTTSDDGVRLWVNGQQIINDFVDHSATEDSGSIALVAGQKYDIKLEYYENAYSAVSQLSWSSTSQAKEIIPQSQLYSPVLPNPPVLPTTITLGQGNTTVNEGDGSVTLSVLRTGDLSGTSSILYSTQSGTAKAGNDYGNGAEEIQGQLTFAPGETSKQVKIPIIDDNVIEGDETFSFLIDQPQGATLGTQRTLGITIQDNDSQSLNFTEPQVNENAGNAIVTVTRGKGSGTASVKYTTVDGTAKAGSDYQAASGTLTFAQGETSKTISISIKDDNIQEANEAFTLKFSDAVGVQLPTNPAATITIIDNDSNFNQKTVVSGLVQPTEFDWSADHKLMFIAQKDGQVKVFNTVTNTLEAQPFIDISSQVNDVNDRGLLGMAVHPDFGKSPNGNNYVYLLFTYDPPETNPNNANNNPNSTLDNPDQGGNRAGRLIRVTADPKTDYETAIAGSEVILLGKNDTWNNISHPDFDSTVVDQTDETKNYGPSGIINKTTGKLFANVQDYLNAIKNNNITNIQDFIATDSSTHSVGSVRFGNDGTLFVSLGDATSYNRADLRALRVQDLDNLSGKILHIDAITGQGLSTNPYYNGDPNSNRSKVYDLGVRNAFRITVNQQTNIPFIGNVGWYSWEEVVTGGPGKNFGWPFYEGGYDANGNLVSLKQYAYSQLDVAKDFYNSGTVVTPPIYAYDHSSGSTSIGVGDFYTGGGFNNALFIFNPSKGTIDALTLNSQNKVIATTQFASNLGVPVDVRAGDDGKLYYVDLVLGEIDSWTPV